MKNQRLEKLLVLGFVAFVIVWFIWFRAPTRAEEHQCKKMFHTVLKCMRSKPSCDVLIGEQRIMCDKMVLGFYDDASVDDICSMYNDMQKTAVLMYDECRAMTENCTCVTK